MIEIILVLLLYLALCDAVMLCLLLHASRAADVINSEKQFIDLVREQIELSALNRDRMVRILLGDDVIHISVEPWPEADGNDLD